TRRGISLELLRLRLEIDNLLEGTPEERLCPSVAHRSDPVLLAVEVRRQCTGGIRRGQFMPGPPGLGGCATWLWSRRGQRAWPGGARARPPRRCGQGGGARGGGGGRRGGRGGPRDSGPGGATRRRA